MRLSTSDFVLYFDNFNDALVLAKVVPGSAKTQLKLLTIAQADAGGINGPSAYNDPEQHNVKPNITDWTSEHLVLSAHDDFGTIAQEFEEAQMKLFPPVNPARDDLKHITMENFNAKMFEDDDTREEDIEFEDRVATLVYLRS